MLRTLNHIRGSASSRMVIQGSRRMDRKLVLFPLLAGGTTCAVAAATCESSEREPVKQVQTGVIRYMIEDNDKKSKNNFVYNLYVPLVYAAVFPLVRIVGRGRVPVQTINKVQLGLVFAAFIHAGYIMGSDSST